MTVCWRHKVFGLVRLEDVMVTKFIKLFQADSHVRLFKHTSVSETSCVYIDITTHAQQSCSCAVLFIIDVSLVWMYSILVTVPLVIDFFFFLFVSVDETPVL
jgi:hypothetical protein